MMIIYAIKLYLNFQITPIDQSVNATTGSHADSVFGRIFPGEPIPSGFAP